MVYNEFQNQMKKWILCILSLLLTFGSLEAQNKKMKIAVMDFRAGVGVSESEVNGLSDMLINTLFETRRFEIVERTQLYEVLKEQKLQGDLTVQQLVQLGRILGVKSVLIGTVNFLAERKNLDGSYQGEYNVDVRAVDVESGQIVTTAGATKMSNSTYREMMEKIGQQLVKNLFDEPVSGIFLSGKMERKGRDLTLGGRELSKEEVRTLVGQENYETYLSARKQIAIGRVFTPIFYSSLGLSTIFLLADAEVPLSITLPIAGISCPLMCIFKGVGKGRINWIADDYNQKHNIFSYVVSPSVMQINTPESQGNTALGMTFSINF